MRSCETLVELVFLLVRRAHLRERDETRERSRITHIKLISYYSLKERADPRRISQNETAIKESQLGVCLVHRATCIVWQAHRSYFACAESRILNRGARRQ